MIRRELTRPMLNRWAELSEFLDNNISSHNLVEGHLTGLGSMRAYVAVEFLTDEDNILFELYTNDWA